MRSFVTLALVALSTGLAVADTTATAAVPAASGSSSPSGYSCAAQNILDACLTTEKPQMADCQPNDWKCLCTKSTNVLTCYNNCPGHPDQFGAQQTMTSYCNAAKAYDTSSSSSSAASATASAAAGGASATQSSGQSGSSPSGSSAGSSGSGSGSGSASSTGSSTSSSSTASASHGAAAGLVVDAGSLLAAVVVGFGFAL